MISQHFVLYEQFCFTTFVPQVIQISIYSYKVMICLILGVINEENPGADPNGFKKEVGLAIMSLSPCAQQRLKRAH